MAKTATAVKQTELEGVRPKRLSTLEAAVRDLLDAKEEHKKTKDVVDEAAEGVAKALKAADETTYGWREEGRLITVSLVDKESVKVTETKSKAKKSEREGNDVEAKLGFGAR